MAEAQAPPKDVELSDQAGEQHDDGFKSHKEEKPPLPDFFPSHGLTTAGMQILRVRLRGPSPPRATAATAAYSPIAGTWLQRLMNSGRCMG